MTSLVDTLFAALANKFAEIGAGENQPPTRSIPIAREFFSVL